MRTIHLAAALGLTVVVASRSWAQTITVYDEGGPRAGATLGYGGHGPDLEASVDSPELWNSVRVRALIGLGRWVGFGETPGDPEVTRIGLSVIKIGRRDIRYPIRPYGGVGFSAYFRDGARVQSGLHLVVGMEGSGERWTIGPEVGLELPVLRRPSPFFEPRAQLDQTARIGVALRRRF
jgi:hypothetical protein